MDAVVDFFGPYYNYVRFVHLVAVMVWVFSTAHAYAFYLVPVFKAWRRNPGDAGIVEMRNWVMERFDHGVIYEHIAFPVILITGVLLYIVGGHSVAESWLLIKLLIVIGLFLPIEVTDYYLSHFGGNKHHIRLTGDMESYERHIHYHWWFLLLTSVPVMVGAISVIFLAVVKPF